MDEPGALDAPGSADYFKTAYLGGGRVVRQPLPRA
jgi:hypothetical protein